MKVVYIEQTIHSFSLFLFLFHFCSSLQSVWTYSLVKHTQQKRTSDKWYIHLDSYQHIFKGNTSSMSAMHHLCEHTDVLGCDGTSFWVCLICCYHHCACCKDHESSFFISLKPLACIASLQSDIFPSKPLTQPWITSSTAPPFIFQIFEKILLRSKFEMILRKSFIILMWVSSIASILNSIKSKFVLCVFKITLFLSTGFLSMSIDMLRCDRWSCCFKEMKTKSVMSVK